MSIKGITIPTLRELIQTISDDLNSRLESEDSRIIRSVLYVLARVVAGALFLDLQTTQYLSKQIFISSADDAYLDIIGDEWGLTRNPATKANGDVSFDSDPGVYAIPKGTMMQDADGNVYKTTVAVNTSVHGGITGGDGATVDAEAVIAGAFGNLENGSIVTLMTPIAHITSEGEVTETGGMSGGADLESNEDFRDRIKFRKQNAPQGGSAADYVMWVTDTDSVEIEHSWIVAPHPSPGQVTEYFTVDTSARVPIGADVTAVQSQVDAERPVTATFFATAAAKTTCTVNATVTKVSGYSSSVVQQNIYDELEALFLRKYLDSGDIRDSTDYIYNSDFFAGIASAEGVKSFSVTDVNGGGASASFPFTTSQFPEFNQSGSTITVT